MNPSGRKPVLLDGVFGRLTTTEEYELRPRSDGRSRVYQRFRCECGMDTWAIPNQVRRGNTNSCGCLHRERAGSANRVHGDSRGERLYRIWKAMRRRCLVPAASNYQWYGGRGIVICAEWSDYPVFREWALANGYADGLEIDRIDSDGDYTPTNCQWISKVENVQKSRARATSRSMGGGDAEQ